MRIGLLGATGRMGRRVAALALADGHTLHAAIGHDGGEVAGVPVTTVGPGCFDGCDVVIDFSLPEALAAALPHLGDVPLVTGTTGLSDPTAAALRAQATTAPVLAAANFSTGVALLVELARRAAAALPDYDVEITETHHRLKQDAPSGTALALASAVAEGRGVALDAVRRDGRTGRTGVRPVGEIGLHALRGGDVVGDHEIFLLGPGERVSLGHVATSRDTFAAGALRAARWLVGRPPGRYSLADVLRG